MKRLTSLTAVLLFMASCKSVLKPEYLEGRPAWQKALYWAGPGH